MNWPARKLKAAEEVPATAPAPESDEARCRRRIAAASEEIEKLESEVVEPRARQENLAKSRPALEVKAARGGEAQSALDTLDTELNRVGRTLRGLEILRARFIGDRDEAQRELDQIQAAARLEKQREKDERDERRGVELAGLLADSYQRYRQLLDEWDALYRHFGERGNGGGQAQMSLARDAARRAIVNSPGFLPRPEIQTP
jgi:chromosome segregation ATPase